MHQTIAPAILYFGTPVVIISTVNEDGSYNLAPMSSAWWLGWRCMLGLSTASKTTENLLRTGECVLNLPSAEQAHLVDRLALTTGSDPVPEGKARRGYRHEKAKFAIAGLTPVPADQVAAPRVGECPVHMEARLADTHAMAQGDPRVQGRAIALEVAIRKVHVAEDLVMTGTTDRIDPDRWNPLIMSFQQFYGLAPGKVHASTLATIPEALYRVA